MVPLNLLPNRPVIVLFLFISIIYSAPVVSQTLPSSEINNGLIVEINELTYKLAYEHDQFYSFVGVRALAMTHLAVHDIINTASPRYHRYHWRQPCHDFSVKAALATSTRRILIEAYPDRMDTINLVTGRWLDSIIDSVVKSRGMDFGIEVAEAYIELRDGDGHEKNGDYTPMTKPGDYQYTPGFDWVWKPDFSVARPFVLDEIDQFRSPPPPGMTDPDYTESFNEVKSFGVKNSPMRTADQTHIAHWWAEFGEHSWNRIGRQTALNRNVPANETNRMFALINMNLYDLYLVSFDSKYHYNTWRPYTAIRHADQDGNPDTQADPEWTPEMVTPPWPEYPSAHAAVGASGAEIMTHVHGTSEVLFEMKSVSALPSGEVRRYEDMDRAAEDCAWSRILNGFHFRFATDEGLRQGRQVARHTIKNALQPLNGHVHEEED